MSSSAKIVSQRPTKAYIPTKFVVEVIPDKDRIPTKLDVEGVPTKLGRTAYNYESCVKKRTRQLLFVVTSYIPLQYSQV